MSGSYYVDSSNRGNVNELIDQAELYRDQALGYANEALASATGADESEANALSSATNAASSASSASTSAANAASSTSSSAASAANASAFSSSASGFATDAGVARDAAIAAKVSAEEAAANAANSAAGVSDALSSSLLKANNLNDLPSASTARSNLGLGDLSVQTSSSVNITGGNISGITDLSIADGGTGSSSASGARTNIGVYSTAEVDTLVGTKADRAGAVFTGNITVPSIQVGQSSTASNNFHWRNLLDGLLRLSRGGAGAPITDVMQVKADNSVEFPGGIVNKNQCTAWVNFNGTGVVAIRDSYNVSSITDNGAGDYTVNFAVSMTNANYSVCDGVGPNNGSSPEGVIIGAGPSAATDVPPTINGFRVMNIVSGAVALDINRLMFQVFGGK